MAILKHIASRNARYSDAVEYLTFEHDVKTGKVLRDEDGNKVRREGILMDGLLCDPATFDLDCFEANMRFGKNQDRNEVKRHSYIISFDPRDAIDNGLTKEMVQEFGLEFARKYLPGYQTIVCTHEDGNNGSGNLHCHIIINSLRIEEVPWESYMDQKTDPLAGFKHRCTPECERFLKARVMEMCQVRDLYQVDLLNPARKHIPDQEYFIGLHAMSEQSKNTSEPLTAFATAKEELRNQIEVCAEKAQSPAEFIQLMESLFHVKVKESRGRYSYIIPGRQRGITDRQLGADYKKEFLNQVIRGETGFAQKPLPYYKAVYHKAEIARITDLSENEKAQNSPGYAYRIKLSNLQKMASSINLLSEKGISRMPEIDTRIEMVTDVLRENQEMLRSVESHMSELAGILHSLQLYKKLKPVAEAMKDGKHSEQFRKEHEGDLLLFRKSAEKLKANYSLKSLPSEKKLEEEYKKLADERNGLYEERSLIRKEMKDLENAKYNLQMAMEKERVLEL